MDETGSYAKETKKNSLHGLAQYELVCMRISIYSNVYVIDWISGIIICNIQFVRWLGEYASFVLILLVFILGSIKVVVCAVFVWARLIECLCNFIQAKLRREWSTLCRG